MWAWSEHQTRHVSRRGAIAALLNALIANRDGTVLSVPVSPEQEAEYLRRLQPGGLCLMAEETDMLLGFQSVEGPKLGEIGTFIRQESRGLGVGRLLENLGHAPNGVLPELRAD